MLYSAKDFEKLVSRNLRQSDVRTQNLMLSHSVVTFAVPCVELSSQLADSLLYTFSRLMLSGRLFAGMLTPPFVLYALNNSTHGSVCLTTCATSRSLADFVFCCSRPSLVKRLPYSLICPNKQTFVHCINRESVDIMPSSLVLDSRDL